MITTTIIYRHRLCVRFILSALLLILLPACGGENGPDNPDDPGFEEGIPTEVCITLSARSGNGTRAEESPKPDGTPKDPVSSIELMHGEWWIVFVNKKIIEEGTQKKPDVIIFTRNDVTDIITSTPSSVKDPDEGYEAETFKIIIPSGTYRIYAFANVPIPENPVETFKEFLKLDSKGKWIHKTVHLYNLIGDNKFIKDPDKPDAEGMRWPESENIPMTGVMTNKVIKNTVEEAFNIELVRAVAKVQFEFSNPSEEEITINDLEFYPITNDKNISFVPNYDSVGFGPNEKLIDDKVTTGILRFNNLNKKLVALSGKDVLEFYCKESLPKAGGGPFTIKLTVTKNNVKQDPKELYTKKITYINRNDWIFIPIEFSDWKIYWKLRAYPPIGGYPPAFDQNEDGSSLKATVTTGGEFELYPFKISKGSSTENYADRVDWNKVEEPKVLEESDDIFITAPKLETDPNNANAKIIVGELDPKKKGTAKVQIVFHLKESTNINSKFTCEFTIIRSLDNILRADGGMPKDSEFDTDN